MASPMKVLADALGGFLSPQRTAAVLQAANENPALYAKLMQAIEADDFNKTLRMVVANDSGQWGAAPARPAPVRPEAPAPLTTAQRMMRDPNIRPAIDANLDRLPPELAERIAADDPDAFMEAFQMIAEAEGELPLRGPDPFENIAPDDGVGMPPELAAMTDDQQAAFVADMMNSPSRTRQMELPLGGENELPSRGLIPFGVRGQGVPVGGPTGMGTARDVFGEMIPAPLRGIPGQTRGLSTDVLLQRLGSASRGLTPEVDLPGIPFRPRVWQAAPAGPQRLPGAVTELPPSPAIRALENVQPFQQPSRAPTPAPRSQNMERAIAAGAAGVGIGALVNQMMQGRNTDMSPELMGDLDDTSMPTNMEELPAAQPELAMEPPVDYSLEARKLIDQLNAMRRQAGGEVPEAAKMQSEIQRLMDLGNKTRKATYAAAPQDDSSQMFQQAQGMIDQVNDLYRQGHSQSSPQVQKIMSEVRRLQSAGDAIRNRRSA